MLSPNNEQFNLTKYTSTTSRDVFIKQVQQLLADNGEPQLH